MQHGLYSINPGFIGELDISNTLGKSGVQIVRLRLGVIAGVLGQIQLAR